jgi:hypothetical protein
VGLNGIDLRVMIVPCTFCWVSLEEFKFALLLVVEIMDRQLNQVVAATDNRSMRGVGQVCSSRAMDRYETGYGPIPPISAMVGG